MSTNAIHALGKKHPIPYERFRQRSLEQRDYVYIWVDGIHVRVRLEQDRLCLLVVIGVRPDGSKELVAIEDGYRESTESWLEVLRGLKERGMRAPCLAVGDGALGFWNAVAEVWPETKEQRDWCHKLANVLDKLPKRLQAKAKAALHEVMYAASREQAEEAIETFARDYGDRHAKAVDCLRKDQERLLTFFDFPVEHWVHLRTSNVIESTFATVRLRQRVTKGPGSRIKGLTMAWKLLTMAEQRWRRLNGSHLLPVVREGAKFCRWSARGAPRLRRGGRRLIRCRSTTFDNTSDRRPGGADPRRPRRPPRQPGRASLPCGPGAADLRGDA